MKTKKLKLTSAEYKKAIELFGTFKERGFSISKDKDGILDPHEGQKIHRKHRMR